MTNDRTAEIAELKRQAEVESIMLSLEGVAVNLAGVNAQFRSIEEQLGVDLSSPSFSDPELSVQADMLKSIAERTLRLATLGAQIAGEEIPPQEGNVSDIIEGLMAAAREQYGTQPESKAPTVELLEEPSMGIVTNTLTADEIDNLPMAELMERLTGDDSWLNVEEDDTTADQDTMLKHIADLEPDAYAEEFGLPDGFFDDTPRNGQPDAFLEDGTAIEFKSVRNPCAEVTLPDAGGVLPAFIDVVVFNDFSSVDFEDESSRNDMFTRILNFYINEMITPHHNNGTFTPQLAYRMVQELQMEDPENIVNPEIEMPMPGEIADTIAKMGAEGVEQFTVAVQEPIDVAEAIYAAFMTSMAKFEASVSAHFLGHRLKEIGLG